MSKSDKPEKDDAANPYKDTLFLPKTDFPMRGGLPQQEPARLAKWEAANIYGQLRADAKARKAPACGLVLQAAGKGSRKSNLLRLTLKKLFTLRTFASCVNRRCTRA